MKWLQDFTLIMRSSVSTLREKIEDPERMLHQLIIDMEGELETVRASVAAAMADEIQLRNRVRRSRDEADQWQQRAENALARGDETKARSALEQKSLASERAESLDTEYQRQQQATARLHRSVRDLEDKIRQARQRQTLLVARLTRAESERKIGSTLNQVDQQSAFSQFSRLEQRVERAEALNEAYDRLDDRDPAAEDLAAECDAQQRKEAVQRELDELKQRLGDNAQ